MEHERDGAIVGTARPLPIGEGDQGDERLWRASVIVGQERHPGCARMAMAR
jgi:hypothetical protein